MTDLQAQALELLAAEFDKMKAGAAAKDIRGGPSCFHVVLTRIALRAIVAALQSRADGPPYPSDDWQANGYKSAAEEIDDMANVGRSLMEHIASVITGDGPMSGWSPADDPAEIVSDMANKLVERADESVEKSAILVAARAWWESNMPNSAVRGINIGGDGRVKIAWRDAEEEGYYTLPVGFCAVLQSRDDEVERLREALEEIERNYSDQNMSHKDFRVGAYQAAWTALNRTGGE